MASWVLTEQIVWVSPLATGFTIVCERCADEGATFPSVQGTLGLEHQRGTVQCPRGHSIRVERDGR
jgi:hypothetical protein